MSDMGILFLSAMVLARCARPESQAPARSDPPHPQATLVFANRVNRTPTLNVQKGDDTVRRIYDQDGSCR
jgi:hypothetical protein